MTIIAVTPGHGIYAWPDRLVIFHHLRGNREEQIELQKLGCRCDAGLFRIRSPGQPAIYSFTDVTIPSSPAAAMTTSTLFLIAKPQMQIQLQGWRANMTSPTRKVRTL